jgi:hypothetical protein
MNQSRGCGTCPVCDGPVVEIRAKLVCARCHAIVETCCDGGKQGA